MWLICISLHNVTPQHMASKITTHKTFACVFFISYIFLSLFQIKNIGSVRGVAGAIRHEIERQQTILENGGRIINETRAWDATERVTIPMRDKEVVQDYRSVSHYC